MGMRVRVDVRDPGADRSAIDDVFAWLRFVDATFSTYRPRSEISRIGRGELARADAHPLVREVLDRCDELCDATGGAFDMRAARVRSTRRASSRAGRSSAPRRCSRQRARGGSSSTRAATWCCAAGRGASGSGIRARRDRLAAVLALRDCAVATSGAYERGAAHRRSAHAAAPRRGALSVTIVGPDLGTADAYATAAFAHGRARAGVDGDARRLRRDDDPARRPRARDAGFLRHCAGRRSPPASAAAA